jgi:hypothetical protein
LLPVLLPSDIHQKAQTPAPREMVAFVTMRPIYLPNDEIYLLAYQQEWSGRWESNPRFVSARRTIAK